MGALLDEVEDALRLEQQRSQMLLGLLQDLKAGARTLDEVTFEEPVAIPTPLREGGDAG